MFFKKKIQHVCDFKAIAVDTDQNKDSRKMTNILWACSCGDWRVDTVWGHWKLEEVRQIP